MARFFAPIIGLIGLGLSAVVHEPACPSGSPNVIVSAIEEVTVYPVYVSTSCTAKTTLTINSGFTIPVTAVPTQIVTSGMCTTTITRIQGVNSVE